jgi:hypothetical protein
MRLESNDKIKIFGGKVIVATTGSVGYTQRLHFHVEQAVRANVFTHLARNERAPNISKRFLTDLQYSIAPSHPQNGIGFGALLATNFDDDPCLVEYATDTFQPEFKQNKLFFVSMGSGQGLADPFLAFVGRVLWKNTLPDIRLGRFGLYWTLNHTINRAPGLVGHPIRMAVLSKIDNQWSAYESADDQEAVEFIGAIEARIGAPFVDAPIIDAAREPTPAPVPETGN